MNDLLSSNHFLPQLLTVDPFLRPSLSDVLDKVCIREKDIYHLLPKDKVHAKHADVLASSSTSTSSTALTVFYPRPSVMFTPIMDESPEAKDDELTVQDAMIDDHASKMTWGSDRLSLPQTVGDNTNQLGVACLPPSLERSSSIPTMKRRALSNSPHALILSPKVTPPSSFSLPPPLLLPHVAPNYLLRDDNSGSMTSPVHAADSIIENSQTLDADSSHLFMLATKHQVS